jgi:hypothetical protein
MRAFKILGEITLDAMQGEDGLGRVEANALNLGHGRLRSWLLTTQLWHSMPWGRPPQQSKIGAVVTPASARMRRSLEQPSVNAVKAVCSVRQTASRLRLISTFRSDSALARAPKTCRPPNFVSTLPMRTSRCRSAFSQLRMKPIQFRRRPAMRRPVDARLAPATRGTAKTGKSHRHPAERRGHHVILIILHTATAATA